MSDVSRNSDLIANLVATPRIKNDPAKTGVVHTAIATHTYVDGDSAPSLGVLLRVPAQARIKDLRISALAFTTTGAVDVGVHAETSPGVAGAAIDADFFATAFDLTGGPYNKTSIESTTNTPVKQTQPLWQALGVAAEPVPGTFYLITSTLTATISSTALDVVYEVDYVL